MLPFHAPPSARHHYNVATLLARSMNRKTFFFFLNNSSSYTVGLVAGWRNARERLNEINVHLLYLCELCSDDMNLLVLM